MVTKAKKMPKIKASGLFSNFNFFDKDALFATSEEDYVAEKIKKFIIGKFLHEEFQKLPPEADTSTIAGAKIRANDKAKMIAEIIVSGMLAQQLKNDLGDSIEAFQVFLKNYLNH